MASYQEPQITDDQHRIVENWLNGNNHAESLQELTATGMPEDVARRLMEDSYDENAVTDPHLDPDWSE